MLANYHVLKGRVWVLVLVWVAVAPYLFFTFESRPAPDARRPEPPFSGAPHRRASFDARPAEDYSLAVSTQSPAVPLMPLEATWNTRRSARIALSSGSAPEAWATSTSRSTRA